MQVVKLDSGYISGTVLGEPGNPVHVFRGIPYAAPPVGDLRWKPPQPVTPWSGIRECTAFSAVAPQSIAGPLPKSMMPQSEDCLYLNVLNPARKASERLPVMVWMHGGAFSIWSGNVSLYNGLRLPLNGVMLVNINVRLGPFGLLAHPLLSKESPVGVSGNYALLDFIAALKWVQKNISVFGGDPDNVTVFGESSGSAKIIYLMASPLAKGLFHRAIGESGPGWGRISLKEMEDRGEHVFNKLGVSKERDPLAAARALPWEKVIAAGEAASAELNIPLGLWNVAVDGWFAPDAPPSIFEVGKQNAVPFIMTANLGETGPSSFISNYVDLFKGANKVGGKGYACIFDQVPVGWKRDGVASAFHTLELPYVFGEWEDWKCHIDFWLILSFIAKNSGANSDDPGLTDTDRKVSETMMTMWTNFARTGNPSIEGVVDWPAWDEEKDQYLYITEKPEVRSGFSKVGQK